MSEQHDEQAQERDMTRRGFLLAASVAAAGPFAVAAAAELKSDRKVRVGVVGGGFGAASAAATSPVTTAAARARRATTEVPTDQPQRVSSESQ